MHCSLLERCDAETYGRCRRAQGIDIYFNKCNGVHPVSFTGILNLCAIAMTLEDSSSIRNRSINLISKYNVIVRDSLFNMTCTEFVGPWKKSLENVQQDGQMCCGLLDCNDIMTCGMSTSTECIGTFWTNTTQSKGMYLDTVT